MDLQTSTSSALLGVSLKTYFGHQETMEWCQKLATLTRSHPAFSEGLVECFVLPSSPFLSEVANLLRETPIGVGAQDLSPQDPGAFTGGVSGESLKEIGCKYVEIGHAERRIHFGETDDSIAKKMAAACRNKLTPVLCVGEETKQDSRLAADLCIKQIENATSMVEGFVEELIVAYEPVWAIGAEAPASPDHINLVCGHISKYLEGSLNIRNARVIYGGSAGPGLLSKLEGNVAGLFLGRFAHEFTNLKKILDEVLVLSNKQSPEATK